MDRKIKGYNIFEILVILVIIGILMAIVIRPILVFIANQRLNQAVNMVVADLNAAKIYSISKSNLAGITNQNNNSYVVYINNDNNCSFDNGVDRVDRLINLPAGITFDSDFSFLFDRKGYPRNASCGLGFGPIVLKNNYDNYKTVCIDRFGRIRVENGSSTCN
ncbi:MAG: prepilin-type cleavage/methylation domain-containing protein [Sulfurihydrogenibium sp.]|uniref:prepilin-type cleavage/methylation domain-containing protein n=1 Tax=Sulfurihydrogenibium sp. TaxID=2053621 RepID=UPI003D0AFE5F